MEVETAADAHIPRRAAEAGQWASAVPRVVAYRSRLVAFAVCVAGVVAFGAVTNVSRTVTADDRAYIAHIFATARIAPPRPPTSYHDEIRIIRAAQRAVLKLAPRGPGIPYGAAREPRDLYVARSGLCYDRSRTIEKILRAYGFETRHVALFALQPGEPPWRALAVRHHPSHAVTEVRTRAGWLVVGSNSAWLARTSDGAPVSVRMLRDAAERRRRIAHLEPFPGSLAPFVAGRIAAVYGLYSRHGQFYPPYIAFPDVNWRELLYNVVG